MIILSNAFTGIHGTCRGHRRFRASAEGSARPRRPAAVPAATGPADRVGSVRLVLALLVVAVSVGLSNFAASIGLGASGATRRTRLHVALIFGLFEGGMPALGLLLGRSLAGTLGHAAHWAGAGLLIATGGYALLQAARAARAARRAADGVPPARSRPACPRQASRSAACSSPAWRSSMDNLVVGFAVGTFPVSLVTAVVVIAAVSVALSLVGLELGSRLGPGWGPGPAAGARSSAAWPSSASASRWPPACPSRMFGGDLPETASPGATMTMPPLDPADVDRGRPLVIRGRDRHHRGRDRGPARHRRADQRGPDRRRRPAARGPGRGRRDRRRPRHPDARHDRQPPAHVADQPARPRGRLDAQRVLRLLLPELGQALPAAGHPRRQPCWPRWSRSTPA